MTKENKNYWFENFETKEKFEPQHTCKHGNDPWVQIWGVIDKNLPITIELKLSLLDIKFDNLGLKWVLNFAILAWNMGGLLSVFKS